MNKIGIVGQGYVGLPLAIEAARYGYSVVGIDIDIKKVDQLNNGYSEIEDVSRADLAKAIAEKKYRASNLFSEIKDADVIVICVPTPLNRDNKPDLSALSAAVEAIAKVMKKGVLIILESTVEPQTTRNFLVPLLEKASGISKKEFDVAFSPERIDPTNKSWTIKNTSKLVAGIDSKSRIKAASFYSNFIDEVIECESLEVAETAKLLENAFRLVNISFINELSIFCDFINIDILKVIHAASTKPYGFMPFYPSAGVGGHCIPIDPMYLANKARSVGAPTRMIDIAAEINKDMPIHIVSRAKKALGSLKNKKILIVGVSYKPNIADTRETPAEKLISNLQESGAEVYWHDELVNKWKGVDSTPLSDQFDLAILATHHDYIDLNKLGQVKILDTRNSIL